MKNVNIEIKARISSPDAIRQRLLALGGVLKGTDRQIDTYFTVPNGRLKIREGTIENCIVWYERPDNAGPKQCDYIIETFEPGGTVLSTLKHILAASAGVRVVVDKTREIYFIGNVKFHIDTVAGLGTFCEIEAIGGEGMTVAGLERQCGEYLRALGIAEGDLVRQSYSELMMEKGGTAQ